MWEAVCQTCLCLNEVKGYLLENACSVCEVVITEFVRNRPQNAEDNTVIYTCKAVDVSR